MNPWHAPSTYVEPPAARSERDVQWVVGWIRDILVIAMSAANLMHLAAHG